MTVFKSFFVLLIGLLGATQAMAGQYSSTSLGKALPSWMEAVGDLNSDGDTAWTSWDGSTVMRAQAYSASKGAEVLGAANRVSQAIGVSARDGNRLWIVGFEGSDLRRLDDHAMMWEVNASNGKRVGANTLNIGAVTSKSGGAGTVQQSAAYGIERIGTSKEYFVVGFARDKVSNATLADPTVWVVDNSGTPAVKATQRLNGLLTGTGASGMVTDVASNTDTNTTWACGHTVQSTGGSLPYVQATCWTLAWDGSAITTNGAQPWLSNALNSPSGFGSGQVVTSLIHRVRTVPIGATGALHTVAIGMAMVGTGASNYVWRGFVVDLDNGTIWKNFALVNNAETMAYDAAGIEYVDGSGSSYGLDVVGVSRTAAGGANNILAPGPSGVSTGALRGTSTRNLIAGTYTNATTTCNIDGDSAKPGSNLYDQVVAISHDGSYRLAQDGAGNLRFLTRRVNDFDIEFLNRTTTSKLTHSQNRASNTYHQMKATFATAAPNTARVRFGTALSCDTATDGGVGTCSDNYAAAFDIASGLDVTLNQSVNATTLHTGDLSGTFSVGTNRYVQGATRRTSSNECSVSSVQPAAVGSGTVTEKVTTGKSVGTTDTDYDGTEWMYCGAGPKWVNTKNDYDHCGACGSEAVLTGKDASGTTNLSQCLWGECSNGSPVPANGTGSDRYKNNTCYISGYCHAENELNPYDSKAEPASYNYCQSCQSAMSHTSWSNISPAPTCCSGGQPTKDVWEKGFRPSGVNVPYSGTTMTATWLPRIANITDGNGWSHDQDSCTGDDWVCTTGTYGVRYLSSYLNSVADQEDWYWFRHLDENSRGSERSEPRIRLVPKSGTNLDLCVYWRCVNEPSRTGHPTWLHGSNQTLTAISASNSPLHDGARGIQGACSSGTSSAARDIEIGIEENGCGSPNWDVDVFIQVKARTSPNTLTCNDTYELQWGNDQYRYDRYITCSKGWWNSPENGKGEFSCDGGKATIQGQPL